MDRKLLMPWSRQMTSRDGCPVAAGSTSSPVTLRLARACGVSFTRMVFDTKRGFCPWLLTGLTSAPGPPGNVPRSVMATAYGVDKQNKDTAINENALFGRDLFFILSSIAYDRIGIHYFTATPFFFRLVNSDNGVFAPSSAGAFDPFRAALPSLYRRRSGSRIAPLRQRITELEVQRKSRNGQK